MSNHETMATGPIAIKNNVFKELTQKVYSNGSEHFYGVTDAGYQHIGVADILEAHGHDVTTHKKDLAQNLALKDVVNSEPTTEVPAVSIADPVTEPVAAVTPLFASTIAGGFNHPTTEAKPKSRFSRGMIKLAGAAALVGVGLAALVLPQGGSKLGQESVSAQATATLAEANGDVTEKLENPKSIVTLTAEVPGVVGEAPCGPKVNPVDAKERFEAGEPVSKPSETSDFFVNDPAIEKAKSDQYVQNMGEKFIGFVEDNKSVTNADLLIENGDNSVAREILARANGRVLESDVTGVQNFQCKNGKIVPVENINMLKKGDQVWTLDFTKEDLKQLKDLGISIPENYLTAKGESKDGIVLSVIIERLACNNPLLKRQVEKSTTTKPSKVTVTTIKGTTTVPPTTTPNTVPTTTPTTTPNTVPTTTVPDKVPTPPVTLPPPPPTTTPNTVPPTTVPDKAPAPPVTGGPSTTVEAPKPSPSAPTTRLAPVTTKAPSPSTTEPKSTTPSTSPRPTSTQAPKPVPTAVSTTAPEGPSNINPENISHVAEDENNFGSYAGLGLGAIAMAALRRRLVRAAKHNMNMTAK